VAMAAYEPILDFYIGPLDHFGRADEEHARRWFTRDEAFDQQILERFAGAYDDVRARRCESWLGQPRGRLAYVIVLDQLARNMFRNSPRAYEADGQALAAAVEGVARGHDGPLAVDERMFLYMPFLHSEELVTQDRSVALFEALAGSALPEARERLAGALEYACKHRDVIARFGRFPHRNNTLGRTCTAEEMEFLKTGSGF
jgi:uncharacterized protein (DUF924 family)